MRRYLAQHLPQIWQDKTHPASKLLYPLSLLYGLIVSIKRVAYNLGLMKAESAAVPVIIVGNITVGGTGKTPLVIWLSHYLQQNGYKVGVISRGYGGSSPTWPVDVVINEKPEIVGDEAVMIRRRTNLPLVVSPTRIDAAKLLIEKHDIDLIISDDGLQHLALNRDLEIIVIDAHRQFGNGRLLPSGPLRDHLSSISVDAIKIYTGNRNLEQYDYWMRFKPVVFRNIKNPELTQTLDAFTNSKVNAVAGIGHPDKFFNSLKQLNIDVLGHYFPDHHVYHSQDLKFDNDWPLITTEKDAVKCGDIVDNNAWYLEIDALVSNAFQTKLDTWLNSLS